MIKDIYVYKFIFDGREAFGVNFDLHNWLILVPKVYVIGKRFAMPIKEYTLEEFEKKEPKAAKSLKMKLSRCIIIPPELISISVAELEKILKEHFGVQ